MVSYQPERLSQLADQLGRRARVVPWVVAGIGAAVGYGAGVFVTVFLIPGAGAIYPVGMAVGLAVIAWFLAGVKALSMQLDAQAALCQMKIAEHAGSR